MKHFVVFQKIGKFDPTVIAEFDKEEDAKEFARLSNVSSELTAVYFAAQVNLL